MILPALRARADIPQVLPRVQACRVAVAPVDADGVVAHRLDAPHLQRGLVHLKRGGWARRALRLAGRRAVRARASGAWAFVAQIVDAIFAGVPVLPVDLDALRFRNGDVFGVGDAGHVSSAGAPRRARRRGGAWRPPASPGAFYRARPRSSPPARQPSPSRF